MAQQLINIGVTADYGTGDTIRGAGIKINDNFTELFARPSVESQFNFIDNEIIATDSNSDIVLSGSGTGSVKITDLTVDGTIRMSDNHIRVNTSNEDLVLASNGSGNVQIANSVINGGTIDNTVIGATTPLAGTFTTVNVDTLDSTGTQIKDNTITATQSNDNIEFTANGSGRVSINGLRLPNADGTLGQVLKTNGSAQLDWETSPTLYDNVILEDGTATVLGNDSSPQIIDSWPVSTYRSVKYLIQISDLTADRYTIIDANIVHNGSQVFISSYGDASNGTGDGSTIYESLSLTVDSSLGNARLLGQVNNTNDQVIKFIKRSIKV